MKLDPDLILKDITESLPDLHRRYRVFRAANGYVVKVQGELEAHASPHGGHVARVVLGGSICGEKGKVLSRRDGAPAVYAMGRTHIFKADGDDDPMAELQASRARCVLDTIRAHRTWQLMHEHIEGDVRGLVARASTPPITLTAKVLSEPKP